MINKMLEYVAVRVWSAQGLIAMPIAGSAVLQQLLVTCVSTVNASKMFDEKIMNNKK